MKDGAPAHPDGPGAPSQLTERRLIMKLIGTLGFCGVILGCAVLGASQFTAARYSGTTPIIVGLPLLLLLLLGMGLNTRGNNKRRR